MILALKVNNRIHFFKLISDWNISIEIVAWCPPILTSVWWQIGKYEIKNTFFKTIQDLLFDLEFEFRDLILMEKIPHIPYLFVFIHMKFVVSVSVTVSAESIGQLEFRFRYRTKTKIVVSVVHYMNYHILRINLSHSDLTPTSIRQYKTHTEENLIWIIIYYGSIWATPTSHRPPLDSTNPTPTKSHMNYHKLRINLSHTDLIPTSIRQYKTYNDQILYELS